LIAEQAGLDRQIFHLSPLNWPWFLRADFVRDGSDLKLVGKDGQEFLIKGYFDQPNPPDITTGTGITVKGDIVARLAGPLVPGQYAQATDTEWPRFWVSPSAPLRPSPVPLR
jgi:hypothetical protein